MDRARMQNSRPASPFAPLGGFLCPVCNSVQAISRLGVTVLPASPSSHSLPSSPSLPCPFPSPELCSTHCNPAQSYCYTCSKSVCGDCGPSHCDHQTRDWATLRSSLDTVLRRAVNQIVQKMETLDQEVVRIRAAQESEIGERARLRREVVTYYEGYLDRVGQHCAGLESKLTDHGEKTSAVLVREELTLEQHRRDLSQLCAQIEKILAVASCVEAVRLVVPVAQRLERISGEIANTGHGILTRLQFLHRPLSQTEIPGLVSSLTVSPPHCRALLHTPVYEKVLCSIPLRLVDDNGLELDIFHDIDVKAVMNLFDKSEKTCYRVPISVEAGDPGGWALVFSPPHPGTAHLAVTVQGKLIKNSPYVINVRELQLEDDLTASCSDPNNNQPVRHADKKTVTFN